MKPRILALLLALLLLCGCAAPQKAPAEQPAPEQPAAAAAWDSLTFDRALPLSYAEQFTVSYAGEDYTRITIGEDQTFLLVAESAPVPAGVPEDVTVLQQPLDHIYLVATAAMDFFRELDAVDRIALSGQKESDWYIDEAKAAMQAGTMVYAGKYSAPDYETILANGCDLAIENTMIYHTPEVVEQLESVGVPVLIERSSYESDPLGRIEWLKLYGALVGKEDAACAAYDMLLQDLQPVLAQEPAGKTVAFFYITTSGAVNVRKSGDYIAKAIRMAGGEYVSFDESGEENALSTMTIQMESFYDAAADADVLINTTPGGMYPAVEGCPVALDAFPNLSGVVDAVYNPLRTNLVLQARSRGIPAEGGLYMLAAQAAYASALFRGCETSQRDIDLAYQTVRREMENIVLIGMPSSGKSTVGRALAERLGKRFADSDALVTERIGMPIADYFAQRGEAAFREREQEAVADLAATGGQVIATGGGAILRPENVTALRRSGRLVFLDRSPEKLIATADRPLASDREALRRRYEERYDLYCAAADLHIDGDGTVEETAQRIEKEWMK